MRHPIGMSARARGLFRRILVLTWLLALASTVGLYGNVPLEAQSSDVTVTIQVSTGYYGYISFNPSLVIISVGGKVTWQNSSSSSIALSSPQAGISTTISAGGSFAFTFNSPGSYSVSGHSGELGSNMTVTVLAAGAQPEEVQEFSLIHSLNDLKIYPSTLTVKKGVKVRLFNTATDGSHPTIAISSDADGKNPVFGVQPFDVEVGKLTVVEFTPDKEGTYFITHHLHGHNILGQLIVTAGP